MAAARHRWFLCAAGLVLVAAVVGWQAGWFAAEPLAHTPTRSDPAAAATANGSAAAVVPPATGADPSRQAVPGAAPAAAPAPPVLHVRLRGLHPRAPWHEKLVLRLRGDVAEPTRSADFDAGAAPDPDGRVAFALPVWAATATDQHLRLTADDADYMPLRANFEDLDYGQELVLDVQVVGSLRGRVVTDDARPVADAEVAAFRVDGGGDQAVARASTADDGTFALAAPPDVPLRLVAVAHAHDEQPAARPLHRRRIGRLHPELLPATCLLTGAIGNATRVPDLVLARATPLRGSVAFVDGAPIAGARVHSLSHQGIGLQLQDGIAAALVGGAAMPITSATAGTDGTFALPSAPGAVVDVAVTDLPGLHLLGDWPHAAGTAPGPLAIAVPLPVWLRAVRDGMPVPGARIELALRGEDGQRRPYTAFPTDADARLGLVVTVSPLFARAEAGDLQSPWLEVPPTASGVLDLALTAALGELAVEFAGDAPVRNAWFRWRDADGAEALVSLARDDRSGPFRLHLPRGRRRLAFGPADGERNGRYLLPGEQDVEVTETPQTLTLPARFGGRLVVHATDTRGLYVAGTCRVLDAAGGDRTARFVADRSIGEPGELLTGTPNELSVILEPGTYTVECTFPDLPVQRVRATVRARQTTDARVRLP